MFQSMLARWLTAIPVLATLNTAAQPVSMPSRATQSDASPALTYKSAFEGYQAFAEEKPVSWKDANETVYRRGGWRAYAKEASGAAAPEAPLPNNATVPPAAPGDSMKMPGMSGMPARKQP